MRIGSARSLSDFAFITAAAVVLAACGGSAQSTTSNSPSNASDSAVAAAKAATKAYSDKPSDFPVSDPLPKSLPSGTTFAYLQCSSPVCAQQAALLQAAVAVTHSRLKIVKSGESAQELQSAMSSLLSLKPDALLIPSVDPDLIGAQLKQAQAAGIPIAMGVIDPEKYGLTGSVFGRALVELGGKLLADWVVTNEPSNAKVVFYATTELNFVAPMQDSFAAEMKKACPGCQVRIVKVPIATFLSTAPSLVVSDLQAHPDTTIGVFGANAAATGLPAALKTAGLTIPYIAWAPTNSNLADIRSGAQRAGMGVEFNVLAWMFVDEGSRLLLRAPLSKAETEGIVPIQFLTKDNLTGDISQGWLGYPDYAQRFTKLWTIT
jgi:ribose transport system substrate-binding protein